MFCNDVVDESRRLDGDRMTKAAVRLQKLWDNLGK